MKPTRIKLFIVRLRTNHPNGYPEAFYYVNEEKATIKLEKLARHFEAEVIKEDGYLQFKSKDYAAFGRYPGLDVWGRLETHHTSDLVT